MAPEPSKKPDWEHWPGRRQPDDGLRHRLRALFAPTDQEADVDAMVAARGRELEASVEQLAEAIADVERREEQLRRLRIAVEEMLRRGSAELDDRHSELTALADELRVRDARLADLERDVDERRRELGAVELHRAAVERREVAASERESAFEQAAATLRERENTLTNAEHRVQALHERQAQLEAREAELVERAATLEERDAGLATQAARLDGLAAALQLREQQATGRASEIAVDATELDRRAAELTELEATLRRHLAEAEATRIALAHAADSSAEREARAADREARLAELEPREQALRERTDRLDDQEAALSQERHRLLGGREALVRAVSSVTSGLGLPDTVEHVPTPADHLLFVPGERYRLVVAQGPAPGPGAHVTVDDRLHVVVRVSPSPLPGDGRRCAILEALPAKATADSE